VPIEGELVRLRPLEPADAERYVRWLNDPEVTRTLTVRYPLGSEPERAIIERMSKRAGFRDVNFAIDIRETGEHIGTVGVGDSYRESRWGTLGIVIGAKEHWGQGYGEDALREMLRFAFWEMNLDTVRLEVYATNDRDRDEVDIRARIPIDPADGAEKQPLHPSPGVLAPVDGYNVRVDLHVALGLLMDRHLT